MINLTYKGNKLQKDGLSISLKEPVEQNPFILTVDTTKQDYDTADNPEDDMVYLHLNQSYNYAFTINWGDGTEEFIDNDDVENLPDSWDKQLSHQYDEPGVYDIEITGIFGGLHMGFSDGVGKIIDVKQWGDPIWDDTEYAFAGCTNLEISATDLPNWQNIVSAHSIFNFCWSLDEIPNGIFDKSTNLVNGRSMFVQTTITSIPNGLFDTPIFDDLTQVFYQCSELVSIPIGLFDNCTNLVNALGMFDECESLESIPSGLFDNCLLIENFQNLFRNCFELVSIPTGLFDNNSEVINFSGVFSGCTSLGSVPIDLITPQNNPNVLNLPNAFRGLTSVSGNSPEVWKDWNDGDGPGYEGKGSLTKGNCFTGSTGFDDYDSIPSSWGGGA